MPIVYVSQNNKQLKLGAFYQDKELGSVLVNVGLCVCYGNGQLHAY